MLTRRSFLAGLITAPAIVAACNIMKVRPVDITFIEGEITWIDQDQFAIAHLKTIIEAMRERNIPAFPLDGIVGLHYSAYVHKARIEEGMRRFRTANQHYRGDITPQMVMLFL